MAFCIIANNLYKAWCESGLPSAGDAFRAHLAACPVCRGDIDYTLGKAQAQDYEAEPPLEEEETK